MRVLMVFLFLSIIFSCQKEDCYKCTQTIRIYCNKYKDGYPKNYKTKFFSCGDNIDNIDNVTPIVETDTINDTIFTYWKDTECLK